MELLKAAMVDKQTFPALPKPNSDQSARVQVEESVVSKEKGHSSVQVMADQDSKAKVSVFAASRTVGFQCIYPEDVEKHFRDNGARSEGDCYL